MQKSCQADRFGISECNYSLSQTYKYISLVLTAVSSAWNSVYCLRNGNWGKGNQQLKLNLIRHGVVMHGIITSTSFTAAISDKFKGATFLTHGTYCRRSDNGGFYLSWSFFFIHQDSTCAGCTSHHYEGKTDRPASCSNFLLTRIRFMSSGCQLPHTSLSLHSPRNLIRYSSLVNEWFTVTTSLHHEVKAWFPAMLQ